MRKIEYIIVIIYEDGTTRYYTQAGQWELVINNVRYYEDINLAKARIESLLDLTPLPQSRNGLGAISLVKVEREVLEGVFLKQSVEDGPIQKMSFNYNFTINPHLENSIAFTRSILPMLRFNGGDAESRNVLNKVGVTLSHLPCK